MFSGRGARLDPFLELGEHSADELGLDRLLERANASAPRLDETTRVLPIPRGPA